MDETLNPRSERSMSISNAPHGREAEVLAIVAQIIREVVGDEWAGDLTIDMETSFNNDIELESIEFVAIGEQLTAQFGDRLDFAGWLSGMELHDIIALRVGQLVEHIARCTSEPVMA
jgi:acyl carrier protein